MTEPTGDVADGLVRELEDATRDAAGVHDVAGQDEKRHGHERKGVADAHGHALHGDDRADVVGDQVEQRADEQGEGYRHAQDDQQEKGAEQQGDHHAAPPSARPLRPTGPPRTRAIVWSASLRHTIAQPTGTAAMRRLIGICIAELAICHCSPVK